MISAGMTNDTISFNLLDNIIREKVTIRDTINLTISKAYSAFLERLEMNGLSIIENLSKFVAKLDVLQSKTYAAKEYGYCRPVINADVTENSASYVDARGLRHVLIEHIQTQELYVTNDICLSTRGRETGMLLYGTNAVGKTSLIRALGIAIIMAQSGMYVPCSALTYRPYRAIFTRILGNDNLFKNLSMFAVEMSELRVILNATDEYSLVLGDELCSGTETESALSIFVSGLTELHKKRSTFLFATHFHEILKFDEIRELKNIVVRHMAVHYDRETDCLVYDRVLREGAGNRLYGLEVAKSLHLPDEFIERAYRLRNKYFPEMKGDLSSQPTRYNSSKIKGICEMCKEEIATEIHHLQEQKLADDTGRIGSIHKNHSANLMGLCEKCHRKMHENMDVVKPKRVVKKKTTKGYLVTNVVD
jgi:DNA mismatch repair protein MutS